jgi:hypothetical protein
MKKSITTIMMTAISFVVAISLVSATTAYAQNATGSIDVESVKPHLDEAKKAFDSGDYATALQHIDKAEDQLDIADDLIEAKLGQN